MSFFWITLFYGFILSSLIMIGTWVYAKKINNYSIVDSVWALSFGILTLIFAIFGEATTTRKLLILTCVGIWSLRLGIFLWIRIRSHHPKEDGRYIELREDYKPHVERGFFWFFQYQAWSVVFLSAPFLLICENSAQTICPIEWAGAALWGLSFLGEGTADRQAKKFKSNPENLKKVCNQGLWKYSRHPNYFFESCIWWSYFLIALGSPSGIFTIYCPLIMLFLLLKVTGVPLSEKQSLKSRGDAYREYQKHTSAFIPWFPKAMVFIALAVTGTAASFSASASDFTANIYAVGKTNEAPVFVQKTHLETDAEGQTHSHTDIVDAANKIMMTEDAVFKKTALISQKVDKFQDGDHYETMTKNDHVIFRVSPIGKDTSKAKESSEGLFNDFASGPTAESFLAAHWDDLLKGKTIPCKFAVNEVRETIGFEFTLKGHKKVGDIDALWVTMKPSSFFISMVADSMDLYLDPVQKRYVRFVGRTPLKTKVDGKLKPFDGEILYHY